MRTLKMGIIGGGMIADVHIRCAKHDGRAEVKWLCDLNEDLLAIKKETFEIPCVTTEYNEILKDQEVDIIVIGTPPFTHQSIFADAMATDKHIMLEKPMTINEEALNEMMDLIESDTKDRVVIDCSCRHSRLQPKFRVIKKMIDSGMLGEIYYIKHMSNTRQGRGGIEYNPTAKWFLNRALAGAGPMMDWGEYDFAFHMGLLSDKPDLLEVTDAFIINGLDQVNPGTDVFDVEEHFSAQMIFDNGLRYHYERSSNAHNDIPNETRIYGTEGGLSFGYCTWDSNQIDYYRVDEDGKGKAVCDKVVVDMSQHAGDEEEVTKHFIDVIEGKEEPIVPIEIAAKHLKMVFSILEAAQ